MIPGGLSNLERARKLTWDDVPSGGFDAKARLAVMKEEGIDVAVLYPSLLLLYGDIDDPKLAIEIGVQLAAPNERTKSEANDVDPSWHGDLLRRCAA